MLNLRHKALLNIPLTQKLEDKDVAIIKNLKEEIKTILLETHRNLKDAIRGYDEAIKEYYIKLLRKDQTNLINRLSNQLINRYNILIDARNICAALKTWRGNFIKIDQYIMTKLACPLLDTHFEEFDKMLLGIITCKEEISFDEPPNTTETEIHDMITEYEYLCQNFYDELHKNDNEYDLSGYSCILQSAMKHENTTRSEYLEISYVYEHACRLLDQTDSDELMLEFFTLFQSFQL